MVRKRTPWILIEFKSARRRKRPSLRKKNKSRSRTSRRTKYKNISARNLNQTLLAILFCFFLLTTQIARLSVVILIGMILVVGFYAFKFFIRYRRKQAILNSGIDKIDLMSGEEFEQFLQVFFSQKGYKVERTPTSGDFGADIIITRDGIKTAIQAKRYSDKVGLYAIQEVVGAMAHYSCTLGMVITNNYFTVQARKLAESNNITLWEREDLIQEINQFNLINIQKVEV